MSAVDVLVEDRVACSGAVECWRSGQIDCLEAAIQTNPTRISEAMQLFRAWGTARGLSASETAYVDGTPQRQTLRFSRSGNPAIDASYRTYWASPGLSEKKATALGGGGTGNLLMMGSPGPACLRCVGLDDLEFLPAADASLTRRAGQKAPDMTWSCASAGHAAVTNDKVCC